MSDIYSCLRMQLVVCQLTHLEASSSCCIEYLVKHRADYFLLAWFPLNTLVSVHGGIKTDALDSVHAIQAKNASEFISSSLWRAFNPLQTVLLYCFCRLVLSSPWGAEVLCGGQSEIPLADNEICEQNINFILNIHHSVPGRPTL